MPAPIKWPDGKKFAFTIFDDTDRGDMTNVPYVYSFIRDLGYRTTKSVWPSKGFRPPCVVGGATCADPEYLEWVKVLQSQGFEIGYHNNTYHSSVRAEIELGLERFNEFFGHDPQSMANHTEVKDGIYWGVDRLSGVNRYAYLLYKTLKKQRSSRGHIQGDPHFWGDLCKEKIKYCRNFVFRDINTLKICPMMPYQDSDRPYVNYWFASSDGSDVKAFNNCISEINQDQLEEEGGACIMYAHFGKGFYENGQLSPRFKSLMERLSKKAGWFVPVSTLLDYLLQNDRGQMISARERRRLELKWLGHKVLDF